MTTSIYRIDINIVDDHSLLTESLADAINRSNVAHVSRTFSTLETCRQTLEERCPDVLLLDISMPDGNGIAFCRQMLGLHPKLKIICITIHDEYSVIHRMMDTGVHGYLLKSSPISELIEAIQTVWKGGRYVSQEVEAIISKSEPVTVFLSNVERNILRLICEGYTNPEIASQLSLSTETVNWYRKRLLAKYGVKNTVNLVTLVLKKQILPDFNLDH
ncbi:MAG: response regulator transcription factor [Prevotella ruminicola]|jgi:DNA-binding NarL/FixJ family response regulator|uniref:Response regulator transcription factor n=1 Tax=Xylanibacter ruminicola TaxID=839 RepID=A0A928BU77_XYLRU|nr:response regulator transcription factor [Xylanibacter ruminicola]